MSSILKVENLCYKDILKNISLDIDKNEISIIVGKNGSGKTTFLKALRGLILYEGYIYFENNLVSSTTFDEYKKNIGFISEINVLLDDIVINNITKPLINLGYTKDKAKEKAYKISKKLGIDNILFKNIKDLSFSEKMIVIFASNVVYQPSILLIDSIFDDISKSYKEKIISFIKKERKYTVLIVTNDSKNYCFADKFIFLKEGKLIKKINKENLPEEEKNFIKSNSCLPFMIDLSIKLKAYNILDQIIVEENEMVNKIWN